jgi:hypothetical protein
MTPYFRGSWGLHIQQPRGVPRSETDLDLQRRAAAIQIRLGNYPKDGLIQT